MGKLVYGARALGVRGASQAVTPYAKALSAVAGTMGPALLLSFLVTTGAKAWEQR